MSTSSLRGYQVGFGVAVTAVIVSVVWVFVPSPEPTDPTPVTALSDRGPETIGEQFPTDLPAELPQMVLWTKPPPVIEPPQPPPTLRLNAQLLAVRDGNAGEPAVATLYLVDTEEIVRLRCGDELQGMMVEEITDTVVRFSRHNQELTISRDAG